MPTAIAGRTHGEDMRNCPAMGRARNSPNPLTHTQIVPSTMVRRRRGLCSWDLGCCIANLTQHCSFAKAKGGALADTAFA